ncbi:transposase family protein [Microbispora sp. NBC_01189]|uniref:transposase family protein n=1 Tax=Microbispora sp. NBC_01189 TaxID=2903583 RepID=UPI002E10ABEA|nr:transposase family protein [Microbispora sp. NBC_01189]
MQQGPVERRFSRQPDLPEPRCPCILPCRPPCLPSPPSSLTLTSTNAHPAARRSWTWPTFVRSGRRSPIPAIGRGRRHPLVVMPALVQAAIVSGAVSYAAIRHWIARAPQEVLEHLGARRDPRPGEFLAPHPDTVCRTIAQVNAASVAAAYAAHRASQLRELYDDPDELIPMTVDGKTQRGTATQRHTRPAPAWRAVGRRRPHGRHPRRRR